MKKLPPFDPYLQLELSMKEVMLVIQAKTYFKFGYTFTYETANKRLIRYELAFNETQLALA